MLVEMSPVLLRPGMKITVGHRPKSAYIARLAAHSTLQSVLLAGQEMHMHLRRLKNEAIEKASVEGDVPQLATDL